MKLLFLIFVFSIFPAYAIECEWWQTKVRSHQVKQHKRNGSTNVKAFERKEHCREKWKDADLNIKVFKDGPIAGWSQNESFKKWERTDIQILLEIFPNLPDWSKVHNYHFYRVNTSIHKNNPASSEISNNAIVIYDLFFKVKNQKAIVGHEVAHHLYFQLTRQEQDEFEKLAGWALKVTNDQVFLLPPTKLILPDSNVNVEEDFSNHLEIYLTNPLQLKKFNHRIFDFFSKRYPL